MSALQGETGHESPLGRRTEMQRLVTGLLDSIDQMDSWEQRFLTDMNDQLVLSDDWIPTPKQLFKCRDINEKY
jgi:hypothetical protein